MNIKKARNPSNIRNLDVKDGGSRSQEGGERQEEEKHVNCGLSLRSEWVSALRLTCKTPLPCNELAMLSTHKLALGVLKNTKWYF